ncbi:MAG: hypothetical protein J5497_02385 [Selenomonadaceae bacterium]|nr:hypothetical protein [Selenomonadaceae bacterium]
MLQFLQLLCFAITDTVFAWHLWTCENHDPKIAFVTALIAGGFWLLAVATGVEVYNERRDTK